MNAYFFDSSHRMIGLWAFNDLGQKLTLPIFFSPFSQMLYMNFRMQKLIPRILFYPSSY